MKTDKRSACLRAVRAWLAACGALATGAQAGSCIQDVWAAHGNSQSVTCTAGDVKVASAGNIRDVNGNPLSQCVSGTTFSFVADFTVVLGAQDRYDIGLYFATDGDPNKNGAISGTCDANLITSPTNIGGITFGSNKFIQLDAAPDTCGDINAANNPQVVTVRVDNVACQDSDGDGKLNLPNCTSWRTSGQNGVCTTAYDAYPGAPSKCGCDIGFNVPIFVEKGSIKLSKSVKAGTPSTLPEPGGSFAYTLKIDNPSTVTTVTIDRICDDQHGTIANVSNTACPAGTLGAATSTSCQLPQAILPGGSYSCDFTANITSATPTTITNVATASGQDQNGVPVSAQVAVSYVPPKALIVKSFDSLACASVNYKVKVDNTSSTKAIALNTLMDSGFGDLTRVQGDVLATTCAVPQAIAAGGTYACSFTARFCGAQHTNTITGVLKDNVNQISLDSNTLTVNVSASSP